MSSWNSTTNRGRRRFEDRRRTSRTDVSGVIAPTLYGSDREVLWEQRGRGRFPLERRVVFATCLCAGAAVARPSRMKRFCYALAVSAMLVVCAGTADAQVSIGI